LAEARCLVEQTLVKHDVAGGRLSLTQSDLLRDVTISIALILRLVQASLLTTTRPFILFAKETADFISLLALSILGGVNCILVGALLPNCW